MTTNILSIPFILLALMITSCSKPVETPPPQPEALVTLSPATAGDLSDIVTGFGVIVFDTAAQRTLAAEIEARVLSLGVQAGQTVERGDVIARLGPSSASTVDITRARRDATAAEANSARQRRLRADGLASDADVEAAETAARDLSEIASSLENRAGIIAALRAPQDGIIDTLLVEPGDLVQPGSQIARIASPDAIQAQISVEIEDAARLKSGDTVILSALDGSANSIQTEIAAVDSRIDPATRLATILTRVPPGNGFLAGEAVRAELTAETLNSVIQVPRRSVFLDEQGTYVFLDENGAAKLVRVEVGLTSGDVTEIISGVSHGDQVVVEGGAILSDGMKIRTSTPAPVAKP